MKFAKDTKLVDFGDRKDESPKNEKEWTPKQKHSQVVGMRLSFLYKCYAGKFWWPTELLYWIAPSKDGQGGA